jgi:hypothetical protein
MTISRAGAAVAAIAALGAAAVSVLGPAGSPAYGSAGSPAYGSAGRGAPARASIPAEPTITPLAAPEPAWFTDALARRAWAAAQFGAAVALPDEADVPTSSLLFPGVRPGTRMVSPYSCTLNYVFGAGANLSIGTAGHCARVGQDVTVVTAPGVLVNIGTAVKRVANGIGDDFALIRIRPQMRKYVSASMSYLGGPTGLAAPRQGDAILYAGHGALIGHGGSARAGIVSYRSGSGFGWLGPAAIGDSGAPVRLLDGRAAGALTHVIVDPAALPTTVAGTTVSRMQQIAGLPVVEAGALPEVAERMPVRP